MKNKTKVYLGIAACTAVMMFSTFNDKLEISKEKMIATKSVKGEVYKAELRNKYLKKTVDNHTLEKFEVLKGKAIRTND